MRKNMGNADRVIRFIIAVVIVFLFFTDRVNGSLAIALLIVAGIFLLTSIIGICPLYLALNIRTHGKTAKG